MPTTSTALLTDRYELTMVDAALRAGIGSRPQRVRGVHAQPATRTPLRRGRRHRTPARTAAGLPLRTRRARLAARAADRLGRHPRLARGLSVLGQHPGLSGGELFFPGSPVLVVEAPFAEGVLLETIALSVLNYDSAVASAAARMVAAAEGRPIAEMGSRRTGEHSAVAAARAAYLAGFAATSNLEAGRTWGLPTMGTAAHAFTLLFDREEDAFRAQVDAMGVGTTLLVDTYEIPDAVDDRRARRRHRLGSVRIDSGDLALPRRRGARATGRARSDRTPTSSPPTTSTSTPSRRSDRRPSTRSGSARRWSPGRALRRRLRLQARRPPRRRRHVDAVGKRSAEKATVAGRKQPVRALRDGVAHAEHVYVGEPAEGVGRELLVDLVDDGEPVEWALGPEGVLAAREHHAAAISELPRKAALARPRRPRHPDGVLLATSACRRSSCSPGRPGTSPGHAPEPRSCRTTRAPACR